MVVSKITPLSQNHIKGIAKSLAKRYAKEHKGRTLAGDMGWDALSDAPADPRFARRFATTTKDNKSFTVRPHFQWPQSAHATEKL